MYFSFPQSDDVTQSRSVDVYTALALTPPVPDFAGFGALTYNISGRVVGPAGAVPVTDFPYSDSATGRTYTEAELNAMASPDEVVDSRKSEIFVNTGGTTVFLTDADFVEEEFFAGTTFTLSFDCYSKAFINLRADGVSTKEYQTSGLELVPVTDLAAVTPASTVRVKALLDGAPLEGLEIKLGYEGCPFNFELDGEVAAMRSVKTDVDGIAAITAPSREGKTYLFAMYLDPAASTETEYVGAMSSLSFKMGAGADEFDAAALVMSQGGNAAELAFPIMSNAAVIDSLRSGLGMVWANDLIQVPSGTSSFVTGQDGQLPGTGTGVRFSIPMDITGASVQGAIGSEQGLALTADIVGRDTFDGMVAFLKDAYENKPDRFLSDGEATFFCPYTAKEFLDQFNIAVMGRFSNGETLDITDNFMFGVMYDEDMFDAGEICIVYGTLYVDSAPVDGAYAKDLTSMFDPSGFTKVPLLYDGAQNDRIDMTYWLASKEQSYGSGCNAGLPLAGLFAAVWGLTAIRRKNG